MILVIRFTMHVLCIVTCTMYSPPYPPCPHHVRSNRMLENVGKSWPTPLLCQYEAALFILQHSKGGCFQPRTICGQCRVKQQLVKLDPHFPSNLAAFFCRYTQVLFVCCSFSFHTSPAVGGAGRVEIFEKPFPYPDIRTTLLLHTSHQSPGHTRHQAHKLALIEYNTDQIVSPYREGALTSLNGEFRYKSHHHQSSSHGFSSSNFYLR